VLVAFSTRAVLYLICGTCEHTWRTPATESGAQDVWTSAAFRISRNMTGLPGSPGDTPRGSSGPLRLRQTGDVPRPRRRARGSGQS
jgi:hypothetical protein